MQKEWLRKQTGTFCLQPYTHVHTHVQTNTHTHTHTHHRYEAYYAVMIEEATVQLVKKPADNDSV